MRKLSHLWLAAVAASLAALIAAALVLPRSFGLTAFSDIVQCFLLSSGAASFVPLVLRSKGRVRLFWSLITLGVSFWLLYQLLWTYYEVVLRRDVPDLFAGDVILFLHLVPLMAAIGLRPHVPRDEYSARLGQLHQRMADLSMLNLSNLPKDRAAYGSRIVVLDVAKATKVEYKLVTVEEADAANGLISTSSPIGRALLGKKVGDEVTVTTPAGLKEYEVVRLVTIYDEE